MILGPGLVSTSPHFKRRHAIYIIWMDYRNFTLNSNIGDNTCNQSEASALMVGNPFRNCARGPLFIHTSRFSLQFHAFAIVQFGKERIFHQSKTTSVSAIKQRVPSLENPSLHVLIYQAFVYFYLSGICSRAL